VTSHWEGERPKDSSKLYLFMKIITSTLIYISLLLL
jgi:hypothetical protein